MGGWGRMGRCGLNGSDAQHCENSGVDPAKRCAAFYPWHRLSAAPSRSNPHSEPPREDRGAIAFLKTVAPVERC